MRAFLLHIHQLSKMHWLLVACTAVQNIETLCQELDLHACRVEFNAQELDSADNKLGKEEQQAAQRLRDAVAYIFTVSGTSAGL